MKSSCLAILKSHRLLAVVLGIKKTNDHAEQTKSNSNLKKFFLLITKIALNLKKKVKAKQTLIMFSYIVSKSTQSRQWDK